MIFYSQCKINIGLRVLSRREDGFHDIESLFYPIDGLSDAIEIVAAEQGSEQVVFTASGAAVDCEPERNLCVRACRLMQQEYNLPSVQLHLHKIAPMGAGLGGGSSDCATTIKGLNSLFGLNLSSAQMQQIGASLGSDVPFFVDSVPAWVSGRGEVIERAEVSLKGLHLVVVKPDIHINTAWAYSKISPDSSRVPLREVLSRPIESWREGAENDFERPIFSEYPLLRSIKERLYGAGALYSSMSGSGASIYGLFSENPADRIDLDNQWFVYRARF